MHQKSDYGTPQAETPLERVCGARHGECTRLTQAWPRGLKMAVAGIIGSDSAGLAGVRTNGTQVRTESRPTTQRGRRIERECERTGYMEHV